MRPRRRSLVASDVYRGRRCASCPHLPSFWFIRFTPSRSLPYSNGHGEPIWPLPQRCRGVSLHYVPTLQGHFPWAPAAPLQCTYVPLLLARAALRCCGSSCAGGLRAMSFMLVMLWAYSWVFFSLAHQVTSCSHLNGGPSGLLVELARQRTPRAKV